jgi:hypothetical protein
MQVTHADALTQHNSINKTHIRDNIRLTVTELFAKIHDRVCKKPLLDHTKS